MNDFCVLKDFFSFVFLKFVLKLAVQPEMESNVFLYLLSGLGNK